MSGRKKTLTDSVPVSYGNNFENSLNLHITAVSLEKQKKAVKRTPNYKLYFSLADNKILSQMCHSMFTFNLQPDYVAFNLSPGIKHRAPSLTIKRDSI